LRTSPTPLIGTDGKTSLSPFRGRVKVSYALGRFFNIRRLDNSEIAALGLLGVAGLSAGAVLLASGSMGNPWAIALLCVAAALAQRSKVEVRSALKASISLFPVLLAAVIFGPVAAMVVSAASMLGEEFRPWARWLVYFSGRAITGAGVGLIARELVEAGGHSLASTLIATFATAVAAQALDVGFVGLVSMLRGRGTPFSVARALGPLLMGSIPFYAPVAACLAFGYEAVSPWILPMFLAPALAAQRFFLLYQDERRLAQDLAQANEHLERANLSFASALVATLDARDRYTAGHSAAVAIYARDIARRMGLSDDQQNLVHLCGLVHDIGKIGLPAGLLEKPGALTLEERREMETHSEIGERILAKVEDYEEIAQIVRHHHERVDGQGYPDGLQGDAIPLLSRIIAVADAYNAMTSDRPYRDAMPSSVARMRLAQAVESQFDTSVTAAFEAVLVGSDEDYRSGTRFDFDLEAKDAKQPGHVVALRSVEVA
jgi:putative nucleotidyltransferase with HDIG domain